MEKTEILIKELESRGINKHTTAPMLFRTAWKHGWEIKPPHFQSSISVFFFLLGAYGIGVILFDWALSGFSTINFSKIAITTLGGGLVVAVLITSAYKKQAKEAQLGDWENYPNA